MKVIFFSLARSVATVAADQSINFRSPHHLVVAQACLSLKVSPTTPLCLFRPSRRDHQPAGSGRSGPDPSKERSETADPIVDEN